MNMNLWWKTLYLVMKHHSLAICSNGSMCHDGSQGAVCQPCNEAANLHVPDAHTASCHCDSQASWLAQADGINLQFMTVNHMHLFKYVVDIPHLDCAVNWWGDHLHQSIALGVINWGSDQYKNMLVMINWVGEYLLKQWIFTVLVMQNPILTEFQFPMISGSKAMILPKCASNTFISSPVARLQTYKFFLQKWKASPSVFNITREER